MLKGEFGPVKMQLHGFWLAIGGLSRAVAIAKQKANRPQDRSVGSHIYPSYNTHLFL